jgi:putative addiction module antidote
MKTKIRKIGNSYGIILPRKTLDHLMVKEGDAVYITEAPDQAVRVTGGEDSVNQMMNIARQGMVKYRNALRELAK